MGEIGLASEFGFARIDIWIVSHCTICIFAV